MPITSWPPIPPGVDPYKWLENWVDSAIQKNVPSIEIARGIATFSIPGTNGALLTPELFGSEGWYWPWNRAGFAYMHTGLPEDARTVFTCAYLTALKLQETGQYRIHKGMPLCNISFAYLKANNSVLAVIPALLGMIEDAFTGNDPTQMASFTNLIAANTSRDLALKLANSIMMFRNLREGAMPLYPETVLDCLQRGNSIISTDFASTMKILARDVAPATIDRSAIAMIDVWAQFKRILLDMSNWSSPYHAQPRSGDPFSSPAPIGTGEPWFRSTTGSGSGSGPESGR